MDKNKELYEALKTIKDFCEVSCCSQCPLFDNYDDGNRGCEMKHNGDIPCEWELIDPCGAWRPFA